MADEKAKADKAPKGEKQADKAPKAEAAAAAPAAAKPAKAAKEGGKGGKEPGKGRPTVSTSYETSTGKPSGPKEKPRLAVHYNDKVVPALMQKFGYKSVMRGRRDHRRLEHRHRGERAGPDQRPEAVGPQGEEGDLQLQAPGRSSDRLHGHAARCAHVRVLRPARERRGAPYS
jgi:hypothetical protein